MTTIDRTGGPAFPVTDLHYENGQIQYGSNGMTLRDYFAAKVLSGLVVNRGNFNLPKLTAFCYEAADEMLKAREYDHHHHHYH